MPDTQEVIKKRYRTTRVLNIGDVGTFNRGELLDSEQIPQTTIDELMGQENPPLEYVDSVKWNPEGDSMRGAWEAIMPAIEDPTPPPTAKAAAGGKQPAGPAGPATGGAQASPSSGTGTDGSQGGSPS